VDDAATDDTMTAAELSTEFDRLSLHQTLIDFEIANARVRDLTARLLELNKQLLDANHELAREREEMARQAAVHGKLRVEYDQMVESRTYRVARGIVAIRLFLRR
jgi:hypothetical protein